MDVQMRGPYWRSTSGSDLDDEVAMRSRLISQIQIKCRQEKGVCNTWGSEGDKRRDFCHDS